MRPPVPGDAARLIGGRDDESRRWLGPGSDDPAPTFCAEVAGELVGWVDYDVDRDWLQPGEVNVGYALFPQHRRRGYATRAVMLLLHHLAIRGEQRVATLLIDPDNGPSHALALRAEFHRAGDLNGQPYFRRAVPPLSYSDGVVTIRPPTPEDLEADLASKDDEQIRWLWLPGQRESWAAMSPAEQRRHAARGLQDRKDAFGSGPKWTFSADTADAGYVAYVDCDLANDHVAAGEANISYSAHPDYRGRGLVSRAVRLVLQFLADHTGCREAHLIVDAENEASRRVATAIGARDVDRFVSDSGRLMVRHVIQIRRPGALTA